MRSEQDGIDYETVECVVCEAQFSNDSDGGIYDEDLDLWFCSKGCQKDFYAEAGYMTEPEREGEK